MFCQVSKVANQRIGLKRNSYQSDEWIVTTKFDLYDSLEVCQIVSTVIHRFESVDIEHNILFGPAGEFVIDFNDPAGCNHPFDAQMGYDLLHAIVKWILDNSKECTEQECWEGIWEEVPSYSPRFHETLAGLLVMAIHYNHVELARCVCDYLEKIDKGINWSDIEKYSVDRMRCKCELGNVSGCRTDVIKQFHRFDDIHLNFDWCTLILANIKCVGDPIGDDVASVFSKLYNRTFNLPDKYWKSNEPAEKLAICAIVHNLERIRNFSFVFAAFWRYEPVLLDKLSTCMNFRWTDYAEQIYLLYQNYDSVTHALVRASMAERIVIMEAAPTLEHSVRTAIILTTGSSPVLQQHKIRSIAFGYLLDYAFANVYGTTQELRQSVLEILDSYRNEVRSGNNQIIMDAFLHLPVGCQQFALAHFNISIHDVKKSVHESQATRGECWSLSTWKRVVDKVVKNYLSKDTDYHYFCVSLCAYGRGTIPWNRYGFAKILCDAINIAHTDRNTKMSEKVVKHIFDTIIETYGNHPSARMTMIAIKIALDLCDIKITHIQNTWNRSDIEAMKMIGIDILNYATTYKSFTSGWYWSDRNEIPMIIVTILMCRSQSKIILELVCHRYPINLIKLSKYVDLSDFSMGTWMALLSKGDYCAKSGFLKLPESLPALKNADVPKIDYERLFDSVEWSHHHKWLVDNHEFIPGAIAVKNDDIDFICELVKNAPPEKSLLIREMLSPHVHQQVATKIMEFKSMNAMKSYLAFLTGTNYEIQVVPVTPKQLV